MIFPVQWEILVESSTQKKQKSMATVALVARLCCLLTCRVPVKKEKKRRGKWKSEKVKKWERCGETARNRRDSNRFSTGYAPSSCPDLEYYHRSSPFVFTKKKKKKMKQDKKQNKANPQVIFLVVTGILSRYLVSNFCYLPVLYYFF